MNPSKIVETIKNYKRFIVIVVLVLLAAGVISLKIFSPTYKAVQTAKLDLQSLLLSFDTHEYYDLEEEEITEFEMEGHRLFHTLSDESMSLQDRLNLVQPRLELMKKFIGRKKITKDEYSQWAQNYQDRSLSKERKRILKKSYFKDKSLKNEIEVHGDVRDGVSRSFYKNGAVKKELHYSQGVLDGVSKYYFRNGKVKAEIKYKDGERLSHKEYRRDGTLQEASFYKSEGLIIRRLYYKNGQKQGEWKIHCHCNPHGPKERRVWTPL